MLSETDVEDHYNPSVRLVDVEKNNTQCGFRLTRGKWDPYPWVSSVDKGTAADNAGLKPGDCLLEVNGEDVVGKRISEIAEIVKSSHTQQVSLLLWNAGADQQCTPEALCCGPLPGNLEKLSACMSAILTFLECPVCLDMIPPPTYQCDNGHLICIKCRTKSERCPVCRLRLHRGRSLLSDQIYNAFVDAFSLKEEPEEARSAKIQQIFRQKLKKGNVPDIKITHSHSNKFLAKLTGKSTSAENLSSNNKLLSPNSNAQLKTKSLSTNEIFTSESPIVSRSGSVSRLSRGSNSLKVMNLDERPASYHGSFESLERNLDLKISPIYNSLNCLKIDLAQNDALYNCPFANECKDLIPGDQVFEHFQKSNHSNNGPLIQYFSSNVKIWLKDIEEQHDFCNVILTSGEIFFLKVYLTSNCNDMTQQDILIWTWYLGCKKTSNDFEIQVKIKHNSTDDALLSVRSCVFPLSTTAQDIIDNKKGIFLSSRSMKALGFYSRKLLLDIHILNKDNVLT